MHARRPHAPTRACRGTLVVCERLLKLRKQIWRRIGISMTGALLVLGGCVLPFPGPHEGRVTDSQTGKPISGAKVEAEWWCHDNPLPDGPGSFFVRSSTVTDDQGLFRLEKETRRGGLFGASFALKISADAYIPAVLMGDRSGNPLPPSTAGYPFRETASYVEFPTNLHIQLAPAAPVLLKAMKSGKPMYQKTAREKLTKLLGVDYKYNADKWEAAILSGVKQPVGVVKDDKSSEDAGCPCPDAADRSGQPREIRRKVRSLVKAAALGEMNKVKGFLDDGMDPGSQNYACRTALMKAVSSGHLQIAKLLLSKGADVNARDDNCRTALFRAASRYDSSLMLETLLSHGAEANARDKDGKTPLMCAATFGRAAAVQILLSNGAEASLKDKDDETAWFKAAVVDRKDVMELLESHRTNR